MDEFCRKCGNKLEPEDEFCRKCGKSISEDSSDIKEDSSIPYMWTILVIFIGFFMVITSICGTISTNYTIEEKSAELLSSEYYSDSEDIQEEIESLRGLRMGLVWVLWFGAITLLVGILLYIENFKEKK